MKTIRKYIEKIKNFNLLNYFIKKRIKVLTSKKILEEGVINIYKKRIENTKTACKNFREKIKSLQNKITGYKEQLRKLQIILDLDAA